MSNHTAQADARTNQIEALVFGCCVRCSTVADAHLAVMAEAVKVVIRCRPLSKKENRESRKPIVKIHKALQVVSIADPESAAAPPRDFTFGLLPLGEAVASCPQAAASSSPCVVRTKVKIPLSRRVR